MIRGFGIDLVKIDRITRLRSRFGDRFLRRCFTEGEIESCGRRAGADSHFAVRFAAKEAFMKALGTGLAEGIRWCDIEVASDSAGKPFFRLMGRVKEIVDNRNLALPLLALTHDGDYGSASVIISGE